MTKRLRFVKIKCECGHVNLIPIYKTLRIDAKIKCERCGKVIVQPKQKKKRTKQVSPKGKDHSAHASHQDIYNL